MLCSQEKLMQEVQSQCASLEKTLDAVCAEVTQAWDAEELERHRTAEAEQLKWVACKAHLVA